MKILHLIYDHVNNPWVGGGGAVRVFEINKRLSARGHQITIICGMYPGAHDYAEGNMEFRHVGSASGYISSMFSYAFAARNHMKSHYLDYDVVIEDFSPWNPVGSFTIKKRPVILQIQNYLGKEILGKYFIMGVPFYFIEKIYPTYFKRWIVLLDRLNKRFHIDGKVIPQGVDAELLTGDCPDGAYVAYLGRIDIHQKGLDILLDAVKGMSVRLKIAGDGRDRKRFLGMLKDIGTAEWVGTVRGEEKAKFLNEAQFLVVPSRFEGQGIVVVEAAACGKPVIVSDIPELRYAVEAGFGLSFRTASAADLREKIQFMLDNQSARTEMGLKGREYAKRHSWERITEDYEKYLLKVARSQQIRLNDHPLLR